MKKKLSIMVVFFYFATNISAQDTTEIHKIENHLTLMSNVPKDAEKVGDLIISPELMRTYGEIKVLKALKLGKFEVRKTNSYTYTSYGFQKQKITTQTFLIKEKISPGLDKISETPPVITTGSWEFAWDIGFYLLGFTAGFFLYKFRSLHKTTFKYSSRYRGDPVECANITYIHGSIILAIIIIADIGISWFYSVKASTGQLEPLGIYMLFVCVGSFLSYLYESGKKEFLTIA